jgi:hypothetical protein
MCSAVCPCANTYSATWKNVSESSLNKNNRTGVFGINATDAKGYYRFSWINVTTTPLVTTYATFSACHTYLMNTPSVGTSSMPDKTKIQAGVDILTYFESKYTCSGICSSGLFYWSLALDKGIPTLNCLLYLKNEIGDNMSYLGVTSVVISGILFFIWIF